MTAATSTPTAGSAFNITVTAEDTFGNVVSGYNGTVQLTTSDGQAVLPANDTLSSGVGVFSVDLKTAADQTVTATDTNDSTITGEATVTVSHASMNHLVVIAPNQVLTGAAFTVTVIAQDSFGNTVPNYSGTIAFSTSDSDGSVTLPSDFTFGSDDGVEVFTGGVNLVTVGPETITATDTSNGSITGSVAVDVEYGMVLSDPGTQSDAENSVIDISLPITDPPGTLTYSEVGLPGGLTICPSTGAISGTITYGAAAATANGDYYTTVSVDDSAYGQDYKDSQTFN